MKSIHPLQLRPWPTIAAVGLFVLLAGSVLSLRAADSNPPDRLTYQGFLTDGNGMTLATNAPKNYDVVFRIYNLQSGGNPLWSEQQTITVDKGYFSVLLGEGSQVQSEPHGALSALFSAPDASDRFVGMTVLGIGPGGANADILPRLQLLSSPYSLLARNAVSASGLVNNTNGQMVTVLGNAVGINNPSPNASLDVNGTANVSGNAAIKGSLGVGTNAPGDGPGALSLFGSNSGLTLFDRYGSGYPSWSVFASTGDLRFRPSTGASALLLNSSSLNATFLGGITTAGSVGINNNVTPDRPLTIEGSNNSNDWLSLQDNGGTTRWYLNGVNNGLNLGQAGGAGDYRLFINSTGQVGIATSNPRCALDSGGYAAAGRLRTVLARQSEGDSLGDGTFLGVRSWGTQQSSYNGKEFSLEHTFYGVLNNSIEFYRGGGTGDGYMQFISGGIQTLTVSANGEGSVVSGLYTPYNVACDGYFFCKFSGNYYAINRDSGGNATWTSSDQRLKQEITTIPDAIGMVKKLRGVTYHWNETGLKHLTRDIEDKWKSGTGKPEDDRKLWAEKRAEQYKTLEQTQTGFVAQEVERVFPDWVKTDEKGFKQVNMQHLDAVLVNAIREQQDTIEEQQQHISSLEKRLNALEQSLSHSQTAQATENK